MAYISSERSSTRSTAARAAASAAASPSAAKGSAPSPRSCSSSSGAAASSSSSSASSNSGASSGPPGRFGPSGGIHLSPRAGARPLTSGSSLSRRWVRRAGCAGVAGDGPLPGPGGRGDDDGRPRDRHSPRSAMRALPCPNPVPRRCARGRPYIRSAQAGGAGMVLVR